MNRIDLALDLELTMVSSERSDLELAPSGFYLIRQQVAEPVLANFVDFRGISNPKMWAVYKRAVLPQALYEYAYIEDPSYLYPVSNADDDASTDSISESDLEDN